MSTGAWIFATAALVLGVAAPVSYAAATSTVAIGNTTNGTLAFVDPEQQILTTEAAPKNIVHGSVLDQTTSCAALYTPPTGKGVVVTSITYAIGTGAGSQGPLVELSDKSCTAAPYDVAASSLGKDTVEHVFPAGLPMPSLGIDGGDNTTVTFTGYLIPASQLPLSSAARTGRPRAATQFAETH